MKCIAIRLARRQFVEEGRRNTRLKASNYCLGLFLRSADGVGLKLDGRDDLFLARSANVVRFRVPLHMASGSEDVCHWYDLSLMLRLVLLRVAVAESIAS